MKQTTTNICGQDVRLAYCAATEKGFEDIAGKSINDIDYARQSDLLTLTMAAVVAAYQRDGQEPPVTADMLLYDATPKELSGAFVAVLRLRGEWYGLPKVVAEQIEAENEQASEQEVEDALKNVQPPTTAS